MCKEKMKDRMDMLDGEIRVMGGYIVHIVLGYG
jgi:hypothetical protein